MIQGFLFDMDGVLFDTERLYLRMHREACEEMGFTIDPELYSNVVGLSAAAIHDVLQESLGPTFDADAFSHRVLYGALEAAKAEGVPVKAGVEETLGWIQRRGYPAAVASSSICMEIDTYLDITGLQPYFKAIVGGDMVENHKPDPEVYLKAAAALGLDPTCCVAMEDSVVGARAAIAAGCVTVMIPDLEGPTPDIQEKAFAVLGTMEELIPSLKKAGLLPED